MTGRRITGIRPGGDHQREHPARGVPGVTRGEFDINFVRQEFKRPPDRRGQSSREKTGFRGFPCAAAKTPARYPHVAPLAVKGIRGCGRGQEQPCNLVPPERQLRNGVQLHPEAVIFK